MKIITTSSADLSEGQRALFAQGAGAIASQGQLSAGLWFDHTPNYAGRPTGAVGGCQIDASPSSARFLSDCADFLHTRHQCQTVIGPMNGNTWLKHRFVLESNGRPPFLMEPTDPQHFRDTFEAAGFSILSRYSSSMIDLTCDQPEFTRLENKLQHAGVRIRNISPEQFEQDLTAIFRLSLLSFSNNFLYTPLDQASFIRTYKEARQMIDPELVLLAERQGELVAYVFCIPDHSTADQTHNTVSAQPSLIVKTLAALPERSLAGLGTVLVARAQQKAKTKGYQEAIHALQFENNASQRISQRFSATRFRRYALMAKSFPST